MRISLELRQTWETADELREYLGKLERTFQRICEMEAETPADWYIQVVEKKEEYTINLTHL